MDEKQDPRDQSRNAVQRANALDESHSVWSLVSPKDRQRIEDIKAGRFQSSTQKEEKKPEKPKEIPKREEAPLPFADDPKKRERFQDFMNYLKRGEQIYLNNFLNFEFLYENFFRLMSTATARLDRMGLGNGTNRIPEIIAVGIGGRRRRREGSSETVGRFENRGRFHEWIQIEIHERRVWR